MRGYLASELKRFGAKVYQQEAILTAYDGTKLEARNIIGSFDPENSKRVLLFAHWDSRPYSDHDPDPSKHRTPLDGADDGGSGVGALLEIARQIGQKAPGIGIDYYFLLVNKWCNICCPYIYHFPTPFLLYNFSLTHF